MKFSFDHRTFNNIRVDITVRLVKDYIEKMVIPKLIDAGWSDTFYSNRIPSLPHMKEFYLLPYLFKRTVNLYPSQSLMEKLVKLTQALQMWREPDGYLFKIKKTGKTISLKDAKKNVGFDKARKTKDMLGVTYPQTGVIAWYIRGKPIDFEIVERDENDQLDIVDGELEVVEVKTGKARFRETQLVYYPEIIKNGIPLRFFHIDIISFEENKFEIKEKLITNPEDIKPQVNFD